MQQSDFLTAQPLVLEKQEWLDLISNRRKKVYSWWVANHVVVLSCPFNSAKTLKYAVSTYVIHPYCWCWLVNIFHLRVKGTNTEPSYLINKKYSILYALVGGQQHHQWFLVPHLLQAAVGGFESCWDSVTHLLATHAHEEFQSRCKVPWCKYCIVQSIKKTSETSILQQKLMCIHWYLHMQTY